MMTRPARAAAVWLLIVFIAAGIAAPARAQDGGGKPPANAAVHVVQPGDTLFHLAEQYHTTVEAISAANGIDDARFILVGQELIIPGVEALPAGARTYDIQPGDTLDTLAARFGTSVERLASDNAITSPAGLFVGQALTVQPDDTQPAPTPMRAIHHARAGDNVFRVALRYNVPLNALLRANDLTLTHMLPAHSRVWIPAADAGTDGAALKDLPQPFTAMDLTPIPAVQGRTLRIHLETSVPATLGGMFMGYPLQVVTQDATRHYAMFGIHPFAAGGVFPMQITATEADGTQTTIVVRIKVIEGGYGAEAISLMTEQQDLLAADVNEAEWQRVGMMMSGFTAHRYFDGLMALPSNGLITSYFGTRRTYNGGVLNTFHSGVDFGVGPGTPILAPAAGVVVMAESFPIRGNATVIDHGWGVFTGYWHQSEIYVQVGDVVQPGQTIGAVGSTGRSTGPHLHWEMWVGGVQVDPLQWVEQTFP